VAKKPDASDKAYIETLQAAVQTVELQIEGSDELPVIYANHVIVNYTGTEFLVSVAESLPEPFTKAPAKAPTPGQKLKARVVARYAFSPYTWILIVESMKQQVEAAQAQGALPKLELPTPTP
jgi:hypothetical protein